MTPRAPASSARMIIHDSFCGTRTTGAAPADPIVRTMETMEA
jgi:hypothetical protein